MIKKITLVVTNKWGLLLLNAILLKNKILEGKWRLIIITNNDRKTYFMLRSRTRLLCSFLKIKTTNKK
jgi:hypothetical protein